LRLYEFQAKHVFRDYGIQVPDSQLASTVEGVLDASRSIGFPLVLKAQVLAGGRGLAGGVEFVQQLENLGQVASTLLEKRIGMEKPVALLVEQRVAVVNELYVAVTWDYEHRSAVLIGSARGGIDIETVLRKHPDEVVKLQVDPFEGFSPYEARTMAARMGLCGRKVSQFADVLVALWRIFQDCDSELAEANPLAILENGTLSALDAKLVIDDKSLFRQPTLSIRIPQVPPKESKGFEQRRKIAKDFGIPTYIEMPQGGIGVIADGAGSGMLTLDLVMDLGGRTRVYCEMGGEITPKLMENTILASLNVEDVEVLLINLIGGLNRMDEMAAGIISYLAKHPSKTSIVVRMAGTNQDEGRRMLADAGVGFHDDLQKAAEEAVRLSGGR
jgi:succinyl-CoA synthetase beta subunit